MAEPLIINQWKEAVADSPHVGIGLLRNVDIEAFPGAVKVGKAPTTIFVTAFSTTFTADASSDLLTIASSLNPATVTAVTVSTTGTLPSPLVVNTNYFVINSTPTTFQLATSVGSARAILPINITDAGTGTHTVTTVNPGTVNYIVKDKRSGVYFLQDSNMRVWYYAGASATLLNGNTTTANTGVGNGLAIFLNSDASASYLFAFRNRFIDVINVFGTTNLENPVWSNSWSTMNSAAGSGNSHQSILGQDNIIYFCDDRYIGTILEKPGQVFDPSNVATYTFNSSALDTPQGEILNWLDELGTNILAAGDTFNKIYPWDRISDSYNLPLTVPENSVKRIKNMGSIVYILAGTKGNVYVTQGTYVRHFRKIPDYLVNNASAIQSNPVTWGGIAARNGALIFGVAGQTSGNSGVYLLYDDGRLIQDNMPSTGSANATAIYAENDLYYFGYSGGADNFNSTSRYSSFQAVAHSALHKVGDKTHKATYSDLEVQIAKPASTGHIRVSWRPDTSSSFTTLATYNADGSATSFNTDVGLTDLENIQIQVEMDGLMELMEVRLVP